MKIRSFVCGLAILSLFISSAYAHPGRTDSNGGHHDYNNVSGLGSYHYHHGYPAHLHENGNCPYDFDDKTGKSSKNSSSIGKSTVSNIPDSVTPEPPKKPRYFRYCFLLFSVVAPVFIFFKSRRQYIDKYNQELLRLKTECENRNKLSAQAELKTRLSIRLEQKRVQDYNRERAKYTALYGGREPAELSGMPTWLKIDENGIPRPIDPNQDDEFFFCISQKSNIFHKSNCRHAHGKSINAIELSRKALQPCQICKPTFPDLSWYPTYQKIVAIKKKYHIP